MKSLRKGMERIGRTWEVKLQGSCGRSKRKRTKQSKVVEWQDELNWDFGTTSCQPNGDTAQPGTCPESVPANLHSASPLAWCWEALHGEEEKVCSATLLLKTRNLLKPSISQLSQSENLLSSGCVDSITIYRKVANASDSYTVEFRILTSYYFIANR